MVVFLNYRNYTVTLGMVVGITSGYDYDGLWEEIVEYRSPWESGTIELVDGVTMLVCPD